MGKDDLAEHDERLKEALINAEFAVLTHLLRPYSKRRFSWQRLIRIEIRVLSLLSS